MTVGCSGGFPGKGICRMKFWGGIGGRKRGQEKRSSFVITVRQDLYVLSKAPFPLKVTCFDWVACRVGVET